MNKKTSTNKLGKIYEYYICSTYRKKSNKLCTKHSIKVENLQEIVLKVVNIHIDLLININKILEEIEKIEYTNNESENIERIIITKKKEINKISNFKRTLYEDWKNNYITRNEYLEYKYKYECDMENLNKNIERLENEKKKYEVSNNSHNEWIEEIRKQKGIVELSRDIIIELIDCIYIKENKDIIIKFNFKDEFKKYLNS